MSMRRLETEAASQQIMPDDEKDDNEGYGNARMKTFAVGVGAVEVLGELATVGLDVGSIFRSLAPLDLLFTLGFGDETLQLFLTFIGVDVYTTETPWLTGGKECHNEEIDVY